MLVMGGGPAAAQVDYDRPGGDYASFPSRSGDPALCAARGAIRAVVPGHFPIR
jgi:hypothetical protein